MRFLLYSYRFQTWHIFLAGSSPPRWTPSSARLWQAPLCGLSGSPSWTRSKRSSLNRLSAPPPRPERWDSHRKMTEGGNGYCVYPRHLPQLYLWHFTGGGATSERGGLHLHSQTHDCWRADSGHCRHHSHLSSDRWPANQGVPQWLILSAWGEACSSIAPEQSLINWSVSYNNFNVCVSGGRVVEIWILLRKACPSVPWGKGPSLLVSLM